MLDSPHHGREHCARIVVASEPCLDPARQSLLASTHTHTERETHTQAHPHTIELRRFACLTLPTMAGNTVRG